MRQKSHKSSAKYDSKDAPEVTLPDLKIGDTVYIKSDARKNKARDPYVILNFVANKNEVYAQKLSGKKKQEKYCDNPASKLI